MCEYIFNFAKNKEVRSKGVIEKNIPIIFDYLQIFNIFLKS